MKLPTTGTFTQHKVLRDTLPSLLVKQRTYAARLATVAGVEALDKAIRKQMDDLLVLAGLKKTELVTCGLYDVRHNERAGQRWLNPDLVTEKLAAAGVDRDLIADVLTDSMEDGDPSLFCDVKVTKGAVVRPMPMRVPGPHEKAARRRERSVA
jgi:hypothetical protein